MNIEQLLQRVAEGYEALIEVADRAGIHIASIASGIDESRVDFVTVDNVRFSIDMRPIVESADPVAMAHLVMRTAHDAARQPHNVN